jgi:D-alanine-D-alanine ligase
MTGIAELTGQQCPQEMIDLLLEIKKEDPFMRKKKIGVLYGGRSGEHQVSISSAASVVKYLNKEKYEVLPVYITLEGKWLYPVLPQQLLENKVNLEESKEVTILPDPKKKGLFILADQTELSLDAVFPVMHGTHGEDGTIQGLLELASIPYVGSGVMASAAGMDKGMMKAVFSYYEIPQVKFLVFWRENVRNTEGIKSTISKIEAELGYPCFVKPANLGSSVGITKAKNRDQLIVGLNEAAQYDQKLIVEEFVSAREIEISVLGNRVPKASIPGEIVPCNEFYDYKAKYIDNKSELIIPAKLEKEEIQLITQSAIKAYQALNCSGLARVDFFLTKDDKRVLINEINTLPGFTNISMYPKLWEATGIGYTELLEMLIEFAEEINLEKLQTKIEFTST